jgi:hypothetical protein
MNGARRVTLSLAAFALICFFLPWLQVSCFSIRDVASGLDLAREGNRSLLLVPFFMLAVLLIGLVRVIWEQLPAVFGLIGTVGGGLSAYLMHRERLRTGQSRGLITVQMTAWFWLGLLACLGVAIAALLFYVRRSKAPT